MFASNAGAGRDTDRGGSGDGDPNVLISDSSPADSSLMEPFLLLESITAPPAAAAALRAWARAYNRRDTWIIRTI